MKITPILIAFFINLLFVFITLVFLKNSHKQEIDKTTKKVGLIVITKAILLIPILILIKHFFDIKNLEFGVFFGLFLFLGILIEISFIIKNQNHPKNHLKG